MPHTVLIAVPQKWLSRQIREFLRQGGNRVFEAATPEAALRILDESGQEVSLLLLDAHGIDAPGLAEQAVRKAPGIKLLVMSGEPEYISRTQLPAIDAGFLEKPFAWCDLQRKVDEVMNSGVSQRPRVMRAGASSPDLYWSDADPVDAS
jgi:DNA-binding NtrC family response regulator